MRKSGLAVVLAALVAVEAWPAQQKKKDKKEEAPVTQVLELPKELPPVVTAETNRLVFLVSALSAKGLLSRQAKDALKNLFREARGASIVKVRAFVAGSGDMRRVQTIVSETFTERKQALPTLSVVQVGALPMAGAQVVMEAVAEARKPVNRHGLAFISGQAAAAAEPTASTAALGEKSFRDLQAAVRGAGAEATDVLRATCFLSSLDDLNALRGRMMTEYPKAALNFVQVQRAPVRAIVECEAVARLRAPAGQPLRLLNPDGLSRPEFFSQIALVSAPRIALSSGQLAFGVKEDDARLAFQRLGKVLGLAGASLDRVAMSSIYPLSTGIGALARKIRTEFYSRENPPASTMLPFEGLPSLDASFAVDVVAVLPNSNFQ